MSDNLKFCLDCGVLLDFGVVFCGVCGVKVVLLFVVVNVFIKILLLLK